MDNQKTELTELNEKLLLQVCITAGKIMMENGAEMHRVEDTMNRIMDAQSQTKGSISFVTPTGIFAAGQHGNDVRMQRIAKRTNNLDKISQVNHLSRLFVQQELSLNDFSQKLNQLAQAPPTYPFKIKLVAAAVISGFMMLLFKGVPADLLLTCLIGACGYGCYFLFSHYLSVRFLPDFIAAFLVGCLTRLATLTVGVVQPDIVVIGAIMALVPGVPITNAIRDFFSGDTISGTIFGVEALWIATMIGSGITFGLHLF